MRGAGLGLLLLAAGPAGAGEGDLSLRASAALARHAIRWADSVVANEERSARDMASEYRAATGRRTVAALLDAYNQALVPVHQELAALRSPGDAARREAEALDGLLAEARSGISRAGRLVARFAELGGVDEGPLAPAGRSPRRALEEAVAASERHLAGLARLARDAAARDLLSPEDLPPATPIRLREGLSNDASPGRCGRNDSRGAGRGCRA